MDITTGGMYELVLAECIHQSRNWLIRVTVFISREGLRVRMTQLPTRTRTPRIKMPISQHCYCVRLATRHLLDFIALQVLDHLGLGLVRAPVLVLRHALSVRVTQLTAAPTAPGVETALGGQGYGVSISACDLNYLDVHEQLDQARCGLVGVALDIGWEVLHGLEAELATGTGTPGVYIALDVDGDGVAVTTGDLVNAHVS